MNQQLQIDFSAPPLPVARAIGDQCMQRAADRAERDEPGFSERAQAFVLRYLAEHGSASGEDITDACKAAGIQPAEVRAFLTAYYGSDQDTPLEDPMHTVTTKPRFGLVMVEGQPYEIADIGMRMLQPRELYRAQGFPDTYVIDRGADGRVLPKDAQVRMCGNSVCPPLARALVAANFVEQQHRIAA